MVPSAQLLATASYLAETRFLRLLSTGTLEQSDSRGRHLCFELRIFSIIQLHGETYSNSRQCRLAPIGQEGTEECNKNKKASESGKLIHAKAETTRSREAA